jgi:hypothetical protein
MTRLGPYATCVAALLIAGCDFDPVEIRGRQVLPVCTIDGRAFGLRYHIGGSYTVHPMQMQCTASFEMLEESKP